MDIVITVVILAILAVLIRAFARSLTPTQRKSDDWPYYAKIPMTKVEQILYHRIAKALPDHIVLAQVQASRILGVKRGYNFREWNNRINRLSLDFVICRSDAKVVTAIELDDATHNSAARIETDEKKDKAFTSAGITILRWQARNLSSVEDIRATIESLSTLPQLGDATRIEPRL